MILSKAVNTLYKTILVNVVSQLSTRFGFDYAEAMDLLKLKKKKKNYMIKKKKNKKKYIKIKKKITEKKEI